jgi:hypothetical protein
MPFAIPPGSQFAPNPPINPIQQGANTIGQAVGSTVTNIANASSQQRTGAIDYLKRSFNYTQNPPCIGNPLMVELY